MYTDDGGVKAIIFPRFYTILAVTERERERSETTEADWEGGWGVKAVS